VRLRRARRAIIERHQALGCAVQSLGRQAAWRQREHRAAWPLTFETLSSPPRRPVAQVPANRKSAVGVGGELAVPARKGRSRVAASGRERSRSRSDRVL